MADSDFASKSKSEWKFLGVHCWWSAYIFEGPRYLYYETIIGWFSWYPELLRARWVLSAEADKTCRDLDNYGYYEKTELNILYTLKVSNKHKAGFCTRVPVHWNRYKRPNNTLQLTEENAMVKKRKQRKCNGYSLVHRYTRTQLKAAMKDIVPQRIFKPRSNKVYFYRVL